MHEAAEESVAFLALATSGSDGEVGLRTDDGDVKTFRLRSARNRGRDVAPGIRSLLASSGLTPADLQAIAVDVGPGSFTGVRIGVATAKALAYALDLPIVAISSLELLAQAAPDDEPALALRDAGRETYYYARYAPSANGRRACEAGPARGDAAAVRDACLNARPVGEDAPILAERLGLGSVERALDVGAHAEALLELGAASLRTGTGLSPHALAPLYLQASAPERRRAGEEA